MPSRVTVVIVAYNSREWLRDTLPAIEPEHRVVVVDNASADGSADLVAKDFPRAVLVRNPHNVGFGEANRQGDHWADGDWVLYLNADCRPDPGAITRLADALDAGDAAAGGGRLLNPDRTLQESVAAPLTLRSVFLEQTLLDRFFGGFWITRKVAQGGPVPQVMGACLMVRLRDGLPIERFDPRYFLYAEDTDLCLRLAAHGPILYVPEATFVHQLGASSRDRRWLAVVRYNAGKELFFRLHRGPLASLACLLLDRFGALLRLVLKPRELGLWWRVLTARPGDFYRPPAAR